VYTFLCIHIKTSKMVVYKQCLIDGCDGVFLYDDGGNGSDGKSTLDKGSNCVPLGDGRTIDYPP